MVCARGRSACEGCAPHDLVWSGCLRVCLDQPCPAHQSHVCLYRPRVLIVTVVVLAPCACHSMRLHTCTWCGHIVKWLSLMRPHHVSGRRHTNPVRRCPPPRLTTARPRGCQLFVYNTTFLVAAIGTWRWQRRRRQTALGPGPGREYGYGGGRDGPDERERATGHSEGCVRYNAGGRKPNGCGNGWVQCGAE